MGQHPAHAIQPLEPSYLPATPTTIADVSLDDAAAANLAVARKYAAESQRRGGAAAGVGRIRLSRRRGRGRPSSK